MRRARWWLCLLLLACAGSVAAQGTALERQVKAAYLYRFAGFVEWPESSFARPDSPLLIGVAGHDALAEQLEQMVVNRIVNGHPVQVRRVGRGDSLEGVHILFVGTVDKGVAKELLGAAQAQSILSVSDAEQSYALGAMINFVMAEERLRFDVALRLVTASRLRISARMLAAAHRVQQAASS